MFLELIHFEGSHNLQKKHFFLENQSLFSENLVNVAWTHSFWR